MDEFEMREYTVKLQGQEVEILEKMIEAGVQEDDSSVESAVVMGVLMQICQQREPQNESI